MDSESVASCIHRRIKASPEELGEAMNGKLSLEDRFLISQSLEEYQMYQNLIETLESEIKDYIKRSFPEKYRILQTIPGLMKTVQLLFCRNWT